VLPSANVIVPLKLVVPFTARAFEPIVAPPSATLVPVATPNVGVTKIGLFNVGLVPKLVKLLVVILAANAVPVKAATFALITPLPFMVIDVPSTFTVPETEVLATGGV
jgi:hypothetical protein